MSQSNSFVPKVFISYQTRAHRRYLPIITEILKQERLGVWLDEAEKVPSMRVQGLEWGLFSGLESADALLFIRPGLRELTLQQFLLDALDVISFILAIGGYGADRAFIAVLYYWLQVKRLEYFYGINIWKDFNESWGAWEARVGAAIGLEVVPVVILDEELPSPEIAHDCYVLSPQDLENGIRRDVLPRLLKTRPRRKPEMLPRGKELVKFLRSFTTRVLRALLIAAAVLIFVILATVIACVIIFGMKAVISIVLIMCVCGLFWLWKRWKP